MPRPFRLFAPTPRKLERDSFELRLPDGSALLVQRVRDPRARRLKLSVDERGARLTLPLRASAGAGERFALQHRDWLAEQIARHTLDAPAQLRPQQTATLPLRGEDVPLCWRPGRHTHLERLDGKDAGLRFTLAARAGEAALARALREFYEAQARADIGRWLPRYLPGLPRPPRRVRFKVMSSQWGSLAPDGSMALDLALVLARPSAFEYVLVHELCHLLHADHSRAFWHEVEARCPDWHAERGYFRAEGRRLKATLRALLGDPTLAPAPPQRPAS